ncbi:MerR family transcriptional regulator [Agreia pratensis]|nr:MerR family transcriptional regulator [Agreia pratensis]
MMKIGEFSGITGLSVKALRHYDDRGVLPPSDVDALSGYREYDEGQVRSGVVVRALREAGVPLAAVTQALASDAALDALDTHRRQTLADRAAEDRAFDSAKTELRALRVPIMVSERQMPAQPYIARVLEIGMDDDVDQSNDDANAAFAEMFEILQSAGVAPSGGPWTALRSRDQDAVELALCWPTATELDAQTVGPRASVGVLPERTELTALWRPTGGETLAEGATHPAIVALFDGLAERDVTFTGREVRQVSLGETEADHAVEVSISI